MAAKPAETGVGSFMCPECQRLFRTGLVVTMPLCPPCWLQAQQRKRAEPPLPPQFQPQSHAEHTQEDWFDYYRLLTEHYHLPKDQGGVDFSDFAHAEQQWFALGYMDGVTSEQGFASYFVSQIEHPMDKWIVPGLCRLDAPAHLALYKEARAIFVNLDAEMVQAVEEYEQTPLEGPFGLLDHQYYELDGLDELIAQGALQDGLLKPPKVNLGTEL